MMRKLTVLLVVLCFGLCLGTMFVACDDSGSPTVQKEEVPKDEPTPPPDTTPTPPPDTTPAPPPDTTPAPPPAPVKVSVPTKIIVHHCNPNDGSVLVKGYAYKIIFEGDGKQPTAVERYDINDQGNETKTRTYHFVSSPNGELQSAEIAPSEEAQTLPFYFQFADGKLSQVTTAGVKEFSANYTYDQALRTRTATISLPAQAAFTWELMSFNEQGLPLSLKVPADGSVVMIGYTYNASGGILTSEYKTGGIVKRTSTFSYDASSGMPSKAEMVQSNGTYVIEPTYSDGKLIREDISGPRFDLNRIRRQVKLAVREFEYTDKDSYPSAMPLALIDSELWIGSTLLFVNEPAKIFGADNISNGIYGPTTFGAI